MKEKAKHIICTIINAFIISGIIILFIGLYYRAVKAGIPYQDPTPELQMQYAVNMNIGNILTKTGFMTAIYSGIIRVILCFVWKNQSKK